MGKSQILQCCILQICIAVLYGRLVVNMGSEQTTWIWNGVTKMRVLTWICDHIGTDMIQNDHIWKRVGVTAISEKMKSFEIVWTCPNKAIECASEEGRPNSLEFY